MRSLITGNGQRSPGNFHHDLQVIHPHADPLSFYFSVKAADSSLLEEVNYLGAGHEGLFTADHIYSDVSYLQSQYDYWLV